jgi:hypothetical protein
MRCGIFSPTSQLPLTPRGHAWTPPRFEATRGLALCQLALQRAMRDAERTQSSDGHPRMASPGASALSLTQTMGACQTGSRASCVRGR